jgi:hypothetical protein
MRRFAAVLAAALLIPAASLLAQDSDQEWLQDCRHDGWGDRSRQRHCEVRELSMKAPREALTVDPGSNGGVEVIGWDADTIGITARIQAQARSQADADDIARQIKIEASGARIRATGPGSLGRSQHWSVMFIVYVPRRTDLTIATDNGPLMVSDVTGTMDLSTENGPLALEGVAGNVRAHADNGPLTVRLSGTRWDGTGLDAETVNGPAHLRIPENYNAKIDFGTVNGPMDVDFPITVTLSGRIRDRISTTLGAGGAPIRVVTTNGPMMVRRD